MGLWWSPLSGGGARPCRLGLVTLKNPEGQTYDLWARLRHVYMKIVIRVHGGGGKVGMSGGRGNHQQHMVAGKHPLGPIHFVWVYIGWL